MAENLEPLFQGFGKLNYEERLLRLKSMGRLSDQDLDTLENKTSLDINLAESFIENVIGSFSIPLGIATYFCIDGKDIPIPMAVEETSIIAAASATAKWIRKQNGTISTGSKGRYIIGQVQFPSVNNLPALEKKIYEKKNDLLTAANSIVPGLVRRGGGVEEIQLRHIDRPDGKQMLILHIYCDPCNAMGANLINQVCEHIKPLLEEWTGEQVGLCILSNLIDSKLTQATVRIPNMDPAIGKGIQEASLFAELDPYRAATHNKGVLNGIDPILIATGNDWRAVEAGIHAYCSRGKQYSPATKWRMESNTLVGHLEAPIGVGTVGGVTRLHPTAAVCMRILGVKSSDELSRITAAVGLVQNLGALRALSTVGIVDGHMKLHATNLAIEAGAKPNEIQIMKKRLIELVTHKKSLTLTCAKDVLSKLRATT